MLEFLVFMFQGFYTIIANLIDDGFANKMSIDAVVAYGSYIPVMWTLNIFNKFGTYAYVNTGKKPKTCYVLTMIGCFLAMLVVIPTYKYIHVLYDLSETQIEMFNGLLLAYALTTPVRATGDFCYQYSMVNLKNKAIVIADGAFWVVVILLDVWVYKSGLEVWWLAITTGIAYVLYDLVLMFNMKEVWTDKFDLGYLKTAFLKG